MLSYLLAVACGLAAGLVALVLITLWMRRRANRRLQDDFMTHSDHWGV